MKIICQIRRTEGYWKNDSFDTDIFAGDLVSKLHQFNLMWKFHFKMGYIDFRRGLSKIAERTIVKNNFDDILMYFHKDRWASYDPGVLIVPIDDDDWFSPRLVKILREIEEPFQRIYWEANINYGDGCLRTLYNLYGRKRRGTGAGSCCYGVKTPIIDNGEVESHGGFKRKEAYYIPQKLSLKINSPACLTQTVINGMKAHKCFKDFALSHIRSNLLYKESYGEFEPERLLYQDLLRELLESARFEYGDMV